jgi:hypothetical protein
MKTAKKPLKKKDPSKSKAKPAPGKELTQEQLEHVAGGAAVDYFLKLDGVPGETQTNTFGTGGGGGAGKVSQQDIITPVAEPKFTVKL